MIRFEKKKDQTKPKQESESTATEKTPGKGKDGKDVAPLKTSEPKDEAQ